MKKAKKTSPSAPTQTPLPHGHEKPRRKGPAPERLSTHKSRAAWLRSRASWPLREAPTAQLIRERTRASRALPKAAGSTAWELAGPTNIGGRCTSIVCDPTDPDRLWIGAAGGGVWHSTDAGRSWYAQWHKQPVLNIGALAIDPRDTDVLYAGTGEANLSADSYPGVGLYKTLNGGATWKLIASVASAKLPKRIGVVAIDPFDSRHVLLGGVSHDWETDAGRSGLFASRNGGATWKEARFVAPASVRCHAIVFHPTRRGTIYCTITAQGTNNGIWRTRDGGATWTHLTQGLPEPERIERTSLALAPSAPDTLFALSADDRDRVLGIFRSTDGGASWRNVAGRHFDDEGQMLYGNTIAVHPQDPRWIVCGGVDLHVSQNGGTTWKRVTRWDAVRGRANYAHADHHALLMPAAQPGRIYDANDGGLDVSEDGGLRWTNRSFGLAVTMYYDVDVAQSDARVYGGGAQDNGTLVTYSGQPDDHVEILSGDGGWLVFDPNDSGHVYASWQNVGLWRWNATSDDDVSPRITDDECVWMAYSVFDPNDPRTVYLGTKRVWRTTNDASTWKAVSKYLDGSPITALDVSSVESKHVYAGTENGGIFRSRDRGRTWSANLAGPLLPGRQITRIETHPTKRDRVYATVGGSGHSHVYRSSDGGSSWSDIDRRRLPDVPHSAIVVSPRNARELFVATDAGVYVSPDDGGTWRNLTRNLPYSPVVDLVAHAGERFLLAATYGRSLWRLKL